MGRAGGDGRSWYSGFGSGLLDYNSRSKGSWGQNARGANWFNRNISMPNWGRGSRGLGGVYRVFHPKITTAGAWHGKSRVIRSYSYKVALEVDGMGAWPGG